MKNCDLGPENAALGQQITFYFSPAVNWFYRLSQMVFLRNSVIESACVSSTNDF